MGLINYVMESGQNSYKTTLKEDTSYYSYMSSYLFHTDFCGMVKVFVR